jgi:3-methylcrotonyl-CoA carboxylase alpha subunit
VLVRYERGGLTLELGGVRQPFRYTSGVEGALEVVLGDEAAAASASWSGRDLELSTPHGLLTLHWIDPFAADLGQIDAASRIVAPMPGNVTRILVEPDTDVPRGAPLIVIEAMKMEHTLRAPADGRLKVLKCAVGDFVQEGTELAEFEPAVIEE